ncbi:hypothetical protein SDRG_13027 [Saprolegnia diclina VS20]|uniref:BZIP domain-containing protein n=1 Tax=Saprolegnia diclina (strain VS20) TaxID=1156394 RepID=T0PUF9_SAPDV|nr:hypothetical protein SDRG_13027 [Saprolegnia diclina VS20]EQC29154.1 hypothetical protein SDRG_13027 [Saprolegnia diclina VS20]|eukprot:XP_008617332.1 hypothetical protein SDRG_13027 [Saprolegnia diclina VS20]
MHLDAPTKQEPDATSCRRPATRSAMTTAASSVAGSSPRSGSTDDTSSPVDVNMLTYFMGGSSDDSVKKAKAKKNRHRLNNIRHRKRKQTESEQLRKSVIDMEQRLVELREEAKARLYKDGPNVFEEHAKLVKRSLECAQEEKRLLEHTISAQHQLIAFYEHTSKTVPGLLRRRRASMS